MSTSEMLAPKPGKPELSELRVARAEKSVAAGMGENAEMEMVNLALKNIQSDALACNVCGHITIRNGTRDKCLNCGNSMGCS